MIRTIVIGAAGRGSRMKHLCVDCPKHLFPVAAKPFFQYVLETVHQSGFERIIVVVGHQAEKMRAFLAQSPYSVLVVDQFARMGEKYGTAVVLEAAAADIGNEPFVCINGDSLFTQDVFAAVQKNDEYSRVIGTPSDHPEQYGVLECTADHWLTRIIEKPTKPLSTVVNIGVYAFQPEIFDALKQVHISPRGEYELTDAVNVLAAQKKVKVEALQGKWVDLGKPEDIPQVEQFIQTYYPTLYA
ncbi:MAG TPA: sugar phosphate nucleotidyltransferase [Patescibacteria group bacterium]|nr:sugar phosphate nucleotidyltransferase [Patescibacteria group bacterium]